MRLLSFKNTGPFIRYRIETLQSLIIPTCGWQNFALIRKILAFLRQNFYLLIPLTFAKIRLYFYQKMVKPGGNYG
jgi:hypothetical protein